MGQLQPTRPEAARVIGPCFRYTLPASSGTEAAAKDPASWVGKARRELTWLATPMDAQTGVNYVSVIEARPSPPPPSRA